MMAGTALSVCGPWTSCCRITAPWLRHSSRQTVDSISEVDAPVQSRVSTVQMYGVIPRALTAPTAAGVADPYGKRKKHGRSPVMEASSALVWSISYASLAGLALAKLAWSQEWLP